MNVHVPTNPLTRLSSSILVELRTGPAIRAKDLQVETYDLRAAIKVVGPRLSHLRRYFGKSAHIIFLDNRRNKIQTTVSPYGLPA